MKIFSNLFQIRFGFVNINGLYFVLENRLHRLFPLINAFDTMDRQNPEMGNLFLKNFTHFRFGEFFSLKLFYHFEYFLDAGFSCLNR